MPENNSAPIIEVNNLSVSFGQRQVVCQAGFHLNAGETFSLIGESGCGKSTILRVIAGLQREWLGGVQLLSLGVIGEYVGKTYMETKQRPRLLSARPHGKTTPRSAAKNKNKTKRTTACSQKGHCGGSFL